MNVGVLGLGVMGSALAKRFSAAGHNVIAGSRSGVPYRDAVNRADIVFLALPWPHGLSAVRQIDFDGRILVDVSNPETEDGRGLVLGHDTSGAEQIAAAARNARVIKSFNYFYAELLEGDVVFDGGPPSILFCGDDADAKRTFARLLESSRFEPIDAGPLHVARYLEPFAMLTVQLAREQGWGPAGIAWRLMKNSRNP
jgi:8-hydroxy-5-deazaflavin:NADPH oxidoreductase